MRANGGLYRRLAWLALCAMLMAALAPGISKWQVAAQRVTWVEICSVSNARRVALDLGSDNSSHVPLVAASHCGYCLLQQHSPFMPTATYAWLMSPLPLHRLSDDGATVSAVQRFLRSAHRTRAPPASV